MSLAISPDGRYALSGSNDKTLKLWDIADGFGKFEREYYGYLGQQGIEVTMQANKPI